MPINFEFSKHHSYGFHTGKLWIFQASHYLITDTLIKKLQFFPGITLIFGTQEYETSKLGFQKWVRWVRFRTRGKLTNPGIF